MANEARDVTPWVRLDQAGNPLEGTHRVWPAKAATENQKLLIAFDQEPKPSIYIGIKTLPDLRQLLRAFSRVSVEGGSVELSTPEVTCLENVAHLFLVHSPVDDVKLNRSSVGLTCRWECTSESLNIAMDMIRALEARGGPAHQYLPPDTEGIEVEIEVDYVGPPAR